MTHPRLIGYLIAIGMFCCSAAHGADEWAPIARKLPPAGIKLADVEQAQIEVGLAQLDAEIAKLPADGATAELRPDVELYAKAVRFALLHDEFYKAGDGAKAIQLLGEASQRVAELAQAKQPWADQRGALVRGYRSRIDGSAQPYGLEIPPDVDLSRPVPLYVWLHGRGDSATDLYFILERQSRKGQIAPAGAIVLHPFGRQCLGFKSAGEVDIFEAIESVKGRYKIDPDRVVLMGFSMGGAGAWHIGAHYADQFAAVHAGAGFVDVVKYQKLTPDKYPAWYEQKLWGLYDVPDYVRNLFNVPTLSYGGEIDPQRASGQIMAEVSRAQGHEIPQIIGPNMPHRYDPASLKEIMRQMHVAEEKGRDRFEKQITLQTRTLRYNHMHWATITALRQHWEDSRLDASVSGDHAINITTTNIDGFSLTSPWQKLKLDGAVEVTVDGKAIAVPSASFSTGKALFARVAGAWSLAGESPQVPPLLHKVHGLQGPIDDAFMEPFLVVTPSARCANPQVQKWMDFELKHHQARWREVFRGDLRIKKDSEVTDEDIRIYNLVLWGDAKANSVIARVANGLPIKWSALSIDVGAEKFDAATHVPVMIYPNPLNPARYVVLNSGPTFRESHDTTNSLQNPKLPDWAVVDITVAPDGRAPGKIADAGFFDEQWKLNAVSPKAAAGR